jgi:small subunit ribosomal protein S23
MGLKQIRPAQVYKAVTRDMESNLLCRKPVTVPPWYEVMNSVPPAEHSVRTITPRHQVPNRKASKPNNLYRPQRIAYPEDALRKTFYKDHPWELARPRVLVESDGRDYQHYDWSKGLRQPGMPLNGEW